MTPAQAIKTCLQKTFRFSGRASISEFWWFSGFSALMAPLLPNDFLSKASGAIQPSLLGLFLLCSYFAAGSRRFQDSGKSKWIFLASAAVVTPGTGFLLNGKFTHPADVTALQWAAALGVFAVFFWQFWILIAPSQPTPNRYGPNPLEVTP